MWFTLFRAVSEQVCALLISGLNNQFGLIETNQLTILKTTHTIMLCLVVTLENCQCVVINLLSIQNILHCTFSHSTYKS